MIFKAEQAEQRKQEEEAAAAQEQETETESKYKTANIPTAELKRMKKEVAQLMEDERLYLNPSLKLSDLANRLNTSSFFLSYLFNQHMHTSFYDYVNLYRVEMFKQCVRRGDTKVYSLDTIATRCGYNSRTSFFRNFKKCTGMTPNEWISKNEK